MAQHLPRSRGQPLGTGEQVYDVASGQVQVGPVRYPAITTSDRARTVLAVTVSAACTSVSTVGGSIATGPPVTATPTRSLCVCVLRGAARTLLVLANAAHAQLCLAQAVPALPIRVLSAGAVPLPIIPVSTQGTVRGRLLQGGAAALPDPIPGRQVTTVTPRPQ
ncbi:hypothetical protein [Microtetraspora malaysiensis]|uniref:Uncharacterized protein n=1 Tax=Microtetraspora malaysiensis TaxID=161358 RepID=A0ABW6SMX3_9ACTN